MPMDKLTRANLRHARSLWGKLSRLARFTLQELTQRFGLSVQSGDVRLLDGIWYVTHSGLLRFAYRRGCVGIKTTVQERLSKPDAERWVFKAIVYPRGRSRGFVGYGNADPSNIPPHMHGAELRIAETRALNRALRKAYGIGLCSVEELGAFSSPREAGGEVAPRLRLNFSGQPGNGNGQLRLRDQLCQLIRLYHLDAARVKLYATEFCGTQQLRDASRELVQDFLKHLAEWAARDLDGLLCHLNRYAISTCSKEVHS